MATVHFKGLVIHIALGKYTLLYLFTLYFHTKDESGMSTHIWGTKYIYIYNAYYI